MEIGSIGWIGHSMWIEQAAGIGTGSKGTTSGWRQRGTIHIHAGILLFPLGATVLEPDLDLKGKRERRYDALAYGRVLFSQFCSPVSRSGSD